MATRTVATNDDSTLTVAQLLALHPFPAAYASAKRIEKLYVFEVPGTPETIWPYIADTSRMNRALGTAVMTFTEVDGKRCGVAKPGGVRHEWTEVPWNWVANQWLTCLRIYDRGFMKVMFAIHRVEPCAVGTRIYLYFGAVPRGAFGSAALRLGFPTLEKAYRRVLPALAKQLHDLKPAALMLAAPVLTDEGKARLKSQRDQLVNQVKLDAACVDALFDWIATGDDPDLHRIQIRERARVWKLDEQEMLRVALHATRAGVMSLSWDTVCPHCRGVRDENAALSSLAAESHCDACQVTFSTSTQESVEVTFRVHSSIRDVPDQVYCSAEPSKKDHIHVQRTLAPGETVTFEPNLPPGRYTVWRAHRGGWYLDVAPEGPDTVTWQEHPEGTAIAAATSAKVVFHNDGTVPEEFTIEESKWKDHALRAAHLLSFQEFRDLFSEDYIGADVRLGVGEQTVLFTDVVGSTAFYAAKGDPGAFVEIKKHFDEVFAIVGNCRGAVVKTIGDAVMATFTNPIDAVRASHQIHKAFHPAREDTPIRLRISLNTGPCIAVRLNSNADFFGGTVNVAAKLQALAEGYQIAMSDVTYNATGVAEYLAGEGAKLDELQYASKALPTPIPARRWSVFTP